MSKYTDWIRTQPCVVTGHIGRDVQAHHIKGYSYISGSSCSSKGSDYLCIPLRHDKHVELHDIGWESWEDKYNRSQLEEAVRYLMIAINENVIEIEVNHE